MTDVLVTIDTELSAAFHQRGIPVGDNIASSVDGIVAAGAFGIGWQMDRLEAHGLKGVFFVDPFPACVYGADILPRIVAPIVARGHEVQLHIHTEWLEWARHPIVDKRRGRTIGAFEQADQILLLRQARALLEGAGVPGAIAFRAGNFGADDRTLAALASLGIAWDSSFNVAFLDGACRIGMPRDTVAPVSRCGVVELPVAAIFDRPGHLRPVQLCALSAREMRAALRHAGSHDAPPFVIVGHSFEMLTRDRQRPNRTTMARFAAMCRTIAALPTLRSVGFADLDPAIAARDWGSPPRLGAGWGRTLGRMAGQAVATVLHERRLTKVR